MPNMKNISPAVRVRAIQMANSAARELAAVVANGLDDAYKGNFTNYMYDWYADLPWEKDGMICACQHFLVSYPVLLDQIQEKFGFNLRLDLKKNMMEADADWCIIGIHVIQTTSLGSVPHAVF